MITFFRNRIPQPTQRSEYMWAKLRFCRTIRVKTFFRLIFFVLTAVFVIWLSSVTKTTWLGIEKDHGLARNTCFGHHVHVKNSCKSPKLSLKISTGVTGALFQHLLRWRWRFVPLSLFVSDQTDDQVNSLKAIFPSGSVSSSYVLRDLTAVCLCRQCGCEPGASRQDLGGSHRSRRSDGDAGGTR